jgi:hypothetical protein
LAYVIPWPRVWTWVCLISGMHVRAQSDSGYLIMLTGLWIEHRTDRASMKWVQPMLWWLINRAWPSK